MGKKILDQFIKTPIIVHALLGAAVEAEVNFPSGVSFSFLIIILTHVMKNK